MDAQGIGRESQGEGVGQVSEAASQQGERRLRAAGPRSVWQRLMAWEPFWLAPALLVLVLAPARFVPAGLDRLAALFLAVPWVVRLLAERRLTRPTPLDWPLLLFFGMLWVGWWPSIDPERSWLIFKLNLLGLALFYALVNSCTSLPAIRRFAVLLCLAGIGVALLTLFGTDWNQSKLGELGGIYSLLPALNVSALNPFGFHPNVAAGLLVMFLPLGLALLIDGPGGWRLLGLGVTVVVGGVLVLTQSRGALIGAVVAIGVVGLLRLRLVRWAAGLGLGLAVVAMVRWSAVQALLERFMPMEASGTFAGRTELWQRAVYMIQDFPFTGIGMGTYPLVVNLIYPLFLVPPHFLVPHAHQTFLQMAVDFGIPGFIAWLGAMVAWVLASLALIRQAPTPWVRGLAIGLLGGVTAMAVHGFVDAVIIYSAKGSAVLWWFLGLQMALWRVACQPEPGASHADE